MLQQNDTSSADRADSVSTILIVEDHEKVRNAIHTLLNCHLPQSQLLKTGTAENALALIADRQPDIVIMDIRLPRMDGIEATRRIKQTHPEIEVVILTLLEEKYYQEEALAAGASAFLCKRTMTSKLIPTLEYLLSSK